MWRVAVAAAVGLALASGQSAGAAVPQTMRAAALDKAGGPEVITLHTLPVPKPDADEVLIAVDSADVAVWDASVRAHPEELQHAHFPLVLGTDGSGVIAAVGLGRNPLRRRARCRRRNCRRRWSSWRRQKPLGRSAGP